MNKPKPQIFATLLLLFLGRTATAEVLYGVTHLTSTPYTSTLFTFDSGAPGTLLSSVAITGGPPGSGLDATDTFTITGIDIRSSDSQMYGLAERSGFAQRVFSINRISGAATLVSQQPFINSSSWGFDVDPASGNLRMTGEFGSNQHLNPNTNTLTTDTAFSYVGGDPNVGAAARIVAVAYTDSVLGALSTTLYGIDRAQGVLARIGSVGGSPNSANTGLLTTIGSLGVTIPASSAVALEISGVTGAAYAAIVTGGVSRLFSVNLATGAATDLGQIGSGIVVYGLAVPEPSSLFLLAGGLVGAVVFLMRKPKLK